MAGRQFRHLSCADQKYRLPLEIAEDFFRQFHRCITDGNGIGCNPRLRPNPLGNKEGVVTQPVQEDPCRPVIDRHPVGLFHLPQDLRLSHDHGIEARRDAEKMANRLQIPVHIQASLHIRNVEIPLTVYEGLQPGHGLLAVRYMGDDLHPVAGGKTDRLTDLRQTHQFRESSFNVPAG